MSGDLDRLVDGVSGLVIVAAASVLGVSIGLAEPHEARRNKLAVVADAVDGLIQVGLGVACDAWLDVSADAQGGSGRDQPEQ